MIYSYYWQCIDRLQLMWFLGKGTLNYDKLFVIKNFFGLTRSLQNFKMSKNQSLDLRVRFAGIYIFSKNSEYLSDRLGFMISRQRMSILPKNQLKIAPDLMLMRFLGVLFMR